MFTTFFYNIFKDNFSIPHNYSTYISLFCSILLIASLGYIFFKSIRYIGKRYLNKFVTKTKTNLDDILIKNKVFLNFARIAMFCVIYNLLNTIFIHFQEVLPYAEKLIAILIVLLVMRFLKSLLSSIKDFLTPLTAFKDKPLDSYIQIFMTVLWIISIAILFSVITGRPLLRFFTALGAFSAVLLLIFKDSILGLVASIQISVNDTVRLQDWITMDKYKADGNVTEINLASVIVRNFDNTITSIPTYSLVSESFKNWRAMSTSGGRRIKRAIYIKMNSIQFVSEERLDDYKKIELISDYVNEAGKNINKYNTENKTDKSLLINGRNLTNFGLFRQYIDAYLQQHPKINTELTLMTRQLPPTSTGVPLEIYAFSSSKEWVIYERIIADIFDHILASAPFFDLEIFENPTGNDFSKLTKN